MNLNIYQIWYGNQQECFHLSLPQDLYVALTAWVTSPASCTDTGSITSKSEGEKNSSVIFHVKWPMFAEEMDWLHSRSPDSLYYKASFLPCIGLLLLSPWHLTPRSCSFASLSEFQIFHVKPLLFTGEMQRIFQKDREQTVMFLCLILTCKVSLTQNSESTAVQAQPTTKGEAALYYSSELGKENKTLQTTNPC